MPIEITEEPEEWNTCIWNCVYKKTLIGNERFDSKLYMGEDKDFNERVRKGKRGNLNEFLYYYNAKREGSLTDKYYYNNK